MNTDQIGAFVIATIKSFEGIIGARPVRGSLYTPKTSELENQISAIIGVSGGLVGVVVLSMTPDTTFKVIERFTGERFDSVSDEVVDAIGEMNNILIGHAKAALNSMFNFSLPTVMTGSTYSLYMPRNVPVVAIPFTMEDLGEFTITLAIKVNANS